MKYVYRVSSHLQLFCVAAAATCVGIGTGSVFLGLGVFCFGFMLGLAFERLNEQLKATARNNP